MKSKLDIYFTKVYIEKDIYEYFEQKAKECLRKPYSLINDVLREYIEHNLVKDE